MENILDALAIYGYSNLEDRIEFELDGVIEKEMCIRDRYRQLLDIPVARLRREV